MSTKPKQITKREYFRRGGMMNPKLFRRLRSGKWQYFQA